jgi:hypothetical protein
MPHPLAAIKLVRSLLIPVVTYAIEQWFDYEPSQSKSRDTIDSLHSIILRPIRAAADLPLTTHRLGMMVDFGIPTLHDIAQLARMRYYTKYANPQIHSHPHISQSITQNTLYSGHPITQLHPSVTRTLLDSHFSSHMNPPKLVQQRKWTTIGAKTRFQTIPSNDSLIADIISIPHVNALPVVRAYIPTPTTSPPSQLNSTQPPSPTEMTAISHLATFIQWRNQWKSINPTHDRATSSPLTLIKRIPGTAAILHCISDKQILRILLRLRHARAFTHDVRARFPSAPAQTQSANTPQVTPFCKHPPCEASQTLDSVQHLLMDCPSHTDLRQALLNKWKTHPYGRTLSSITSLRLHMLLGEPPGNYNRAYRNKYVKWYEPLVEFIRAVNTKLPTTEQYPKPL